MTRGLVWAGPGISLLNEIGDILDGSSATPALFLSRAKHCRFQALFRPKATMTRSERIEHDMVLIADDRDHHFFQFDIVIDKINGGVI
jgi:hypothetical protein